MDFSGAIVCVFVVALDITAGILGLRGYNAQNEVRHLHFLFIECKQGSHQAFQLGVAAASLLLIAHAIGNVAGGCICYGSKEELQNSPVNKQIAGIALLLSWIMLAVGFMLLILGAMYNNRSNTSCSFSTRHKFLWYGGVVCFVHAGLMAAYYLSATAVMGPLDKTTRGLSMAERG